MTRNRRCRRCGAPSGAFWYCGTHRKDNRAKARARNRARRRRAPLASSLLYSDITKERRP